MILCLIGSTGSGKSAIQSELLKLPDKLNNLISNNHPLYNLTTVSQITTRPKREGEIEGKEYKFISTFDFITLLDNDKLAEYRKYETVYGTWYYGILKDDLFTDKNIIIPVSLDQYYKFMKFDKLKNTIDSIHLIPQIIKIDDRIRLHRTLDRLPSNYSSKDILEVCNRFSRDYKKEHILEDIDIDTITVNNNSSISDTVGKIYRNISWIYSYKSIDIINDFNRKVEELYGK